MAQGAVGAVGCSTKASIEEPYSRFACAAPATPAGGPLSATVVQELFVTTDYRL